MAENVSKQITFRGKSLKELQEMSIIDFAKLCTSRARRTLLSTGFDKRIYKKIDALKKNPRAKPIRTHRRDLVVIPAMIGIKFAVHKGKEFESVDITLKMLGHYLGEFALTRKRLQHGKAGIGATKSSTAVTARG
ncbi:MAG: ribosomal protein S19 family protein [Candidatus Diapherotrites archaeon]|nr:ribosomal protein S19 family protein [Candidatus Diapherotrites archaeon]